MTASVTFAVLGTPVPQGSMKAYGSRVVVTTLNLLPAGAVTLLLLHIVTSLKTGTFTLQYHCVVSSCSLALCRITAQAKTPVS